MGLNQIIAVGSSSSHLKVSQSFPPSYVSFSLSQSPHMMLKVLGCFLPYFECSVYWVMDHIYCRCESSGRMVFTYLAHPQSWEVDHGDSFWIFEVLWLLLQIFLADFTPSPGRTACNFSISIHCKLLSLFRWRQAQSMAAFISPSDILLWVFSKLCTRKSEELYVQGFPWHPFLSP